MTSSYASPGVYREDIVVRPVATMATGVPGFVGFGSAENPLLVRHLEELGDRFGGEGYVSSAVSGFFANGGVRCYVVGAEHSNGEAGLIKGIKKLAPIAEVDLVAVPDAMRLLTDEAMQRVQANLVAHCRSEGNRFAILDAPSGLDPSMTRDPSLESTLVGWRDRVAPGCEQPANAALYFPWLKVRDAISGGARLVPPCGHIAGIFARSDAGEGVFKAPANEEVQEALDLEFPVDSDTQNALNPVGINCMRALPGRGLRVWGARTLSTDPNWRYIQVRRLFLTLQRWLDQNLAWAAFEPNSPRLWNRIERDLNLHLGQLWRRGALKGSSASEAYYVKCDAETNPTETRDQGHVVTEIGLAPAWPAEFIVVRVTQRPGSTEFDQ